ncbi:MAG: PadR family transcriptional regulator [Spirochaetes bacterium]|nr:PadR family transcriptional regulator [Spirochaetota bacterium]
MEFSKDLIAASATPLILAILSENESYGYAIIKQVKELSQEKIQWTEGMLYPVLHRLEQQEAIESYWKEAENGRKRKYYRIKSQGKALLKDQKDCWLVMFEVLEKTWNKLSLLVSYNCLSGK